MWLLLVGVAPALVLFADPPVPAGKSHALLLVGLPGDREHETLFADTAACWRDWLTGTADFPPDNVTILFGGDGRKGLAKGPATREGIEKEVVALRRTLQPEDRLWVFLLGHADHDGERTAFHLPGRDIDAKELGKLFSGLGCKEQVFWITTPASGYFLRPLSTKGRIVITATEADAEINETEFPHALADVLKQPMKKLDDNGDGEVSILELYRHTVAEVQARFAADKRVPTEHSLLDDNGDGSGTEEPIVAGEQEKKPTADGSLAARTFLRLRSPGPRR